jgi:copper chaperone
MVTTRYAVTGMTCGHCVSAVSAEVGAVDGVTGVDVDLAIGVVTVMSTGTLDDATIHAAIDEAGYDVAG